MTSSEKKHAAWIDLTAGALGGTIAKSLLCPIQRVVVMQQLGQHKEYRTLGLFRYVYQHDGLKGFWKGNLTSMIIRVPYSGLQYMLYAKLKFLAQDWIDDNRKKCGSKEVGRAADITEKFFAKCGAAGVSAAVAGAAVYPGEVVRLRLMSGERQFQGIINTARLVYRETNSIKNFYRGLGASLIQRVPDLLISFATYETVKYNMLESVNFDTFLHYCGCNTEGKAKDIIATMVGGSLAALASISVVFPLDVAKRRIGMSGQGKEKEIHRSVIQCLSKIYKHEGFHAWYAGAAMEAVRCVPQVVLMWFFIEAVQKQLESAEKKWSKS